MAPDKNDTNMKSQRKNLDTGIIVYDAEMFSHAGLVPGRDWFEPEKWENQGLVTARQRGRGTALTIKTPIGSCVLRQYLRGGLVGRFVRSRYMFTGYENSRPIREFRILEQLAELGLPAPRPVTALCQRHGWNTTGALMTLEIENVRPLEQVAKSMDDSAWQLVGKAIRRFHNNGLVHADLTVRNILIQNGGKVFLVDFDRARFQRNAKSAFRRNLKRLRRSMVKSQAEYDRGLNTQAWKQLLKGYG